MEGQAGPQQINEPRREELLPQHAPVTSLKQDASQPAPRRTELVGLLGDSDQEGVQRLYLNQQRDYYAQFKIADILQKEIVPADHSPFPGIEVTKVFIAPEAIQYTWVSSLQPMDQFDLDVRLGVVPSPTALGAVAAEELLSDNCGQAGGPGEYGQFKLVWEHVPRQQ